MNNHYYELYRTEYGKWKDTQDTVHDLEEKVKSLTFSLKAANSMYYTEDARRIIARTNLQRDESLSKQRQLETEVANLTTAATLANERVIELKAQLAYTKGLLEQTQADLRNSLRSLLLAKLTLNSAEL